MCRLVVMHPCTLVSTPAPVYCVGAAETEASLKKAESERGEQPASTGSSSPTQTVSETLKAAAGSFEQAAAAVKQGASKVADKVGSMATDLYNKVLGKKQEEL